MPFTVARPVTLVGGVPKAPPARSRYPPLKTHDLLPLPPPSHNLMLMEHFAGCEERSLEGWINATPSGRIQCLDPGVEGRLIGETGFHNTFPRWYPNCLCFQPITAIAACHNGPTITDRLGNSELPREQTSDQSLCGLMHSSKCVNDQVSSVVVAAAMRAIVQPLSRTTRRCSVRAPLQRRHGRSRSLYPGSSNQAALHWTS